MKYAVCIEMLYTEVPFYDRIALAKADGFDYITFWGFEDKDIPRLKAECDKHQMQVADFVGDNNEYSMLLAEDHEGYYTMFLQAVEVAKILGTKYILLHSDSTMHWVAKSVPDTVTAYEKTQNMITILKRMRPVAEAAGITLLLEGLNNKVDHFGYEVDNTADGVLIIREVQSDYVKYLYDIYHMQIMEGNVINNIQNHLQDIGYVHFGDVPGRHEPNTGELNLPNILNALVKMGYDGMFEFELNPQYDTQTAVAAIKTAIQQSNATAIA